MENEKNVVTEQTLAQAWQKIKEQLYKSGIFDYDLFETTFEETVKMLSCYDSSETVDKKHMDLVVNAYAFADLNTDYLNDLMFKAATILTERMLHYYIVDAQKKNLLDDTTCIYVLERKKQYVLNFNNVRESMQVLVDIV